MADLFEKRIRRAEALEKQWPFAADLLAFLKHLLPFQAGVFKQMPGGFSEPRGQAAVLVHLATILKNHAPQLLAEKARDVASWADPLRDHALTQFWQEAGAPGPDPLFDALARIALHPWAMSIDAAYRPHSAREGEPQQRCPRCGQPPLVSVLREDKTADTVRRTLVCSLCSLEWEFPRIMCPSCREEKTEKLPRYSAQEIPWMRVEACDACGKYLKSVDLTLNWEAEPVVDELASTPLDVIAHEHGYVKITPNLAGV